MIADAAFLEAFLRGTQGDTAGMMVEANDAATGVQADVRKAQRNVRSTLTRLEKIAIDYGVDLTGT